MARGSAFLHTPSTRMRLIQIGLLALTCLAYLAMIVAAALVNL